MPVATTATGTGDLSVTATGTGTLSAAKGYGKLTAGSSEITEVGISLGGYAVGQVIEVIGSEAYGGSIEPGTTITAVDPETETLTLSAPATGSTSEGDARSEFRAGSLEVTEVRTTKGPFEVGVEVAGAGIQTGTTITEVEPHGGRVPGALQARHAGG